MPGIEEFLRKKKHNFLS